MNTLAPDQLLLKRMRAVAECPSEEFRALLKAGGIDARSGLRNHNWSDLSFAGEDLRSLDFSRCKLHGCNFTGALIAGARFDQARLGAVLHDPARDPSLPAVHTGIADLRAAKDWAEYRDGWTRGPRTLIERHPDWGLHELAPEVLPQSDDHLPIGAIFSDAPGLAPELVVVPPGSFMMGTELGEIGALTLAAHESDGHLIESEGPQHLVTMAQPFAVGRFAVTFEEWDIAQRHPDWRRHSGLHPRLPEDRKWGRGRYPVVNVTWDDAQGYCRWLAAVTDKAYRLPSESEWEYCCRAGTQTPFWWGQSITTNQANFDGSVHAKGECRQRTVSVDSFEANSWGLYQVHGNVWEWCQDEKHDNYVGAPDDGSAWESRAQGGLRVVRGGSWNNFPWVVRSAHRFGNATNDRGYDVGFRVIRTLHPLDHNHAPWGPGA